MCAQSIGVQCNRWKFKPSLWKQLFNKRTTESTETVLTPTPTLLPYDKTFCDPQRIDCWETYTSDLGFTFKYPKGSFIKHTSSGDNDYTRIQNYTEPSDERVLGPGAYYLEITSFSKQKNQKAYFSACKNIVADYTVKGKIYVGDEVDGGGDSGGKVKAACFQINKGDSVIRGTENNIETPIINKIFSTLETH